MSCIPENLLKIKDDRSALRFANAAGVDRNQMQRGLKKGDINLESLIRLCKVENASLDWITTGQGAPFHVVHFNSDAELAEELMLHWNDCARDWNVTVVAEKKTQAPAAVILSMPVQDVVKKKDETITIDYFNLAILCGPVGPLSAKAVLKPGWGGRYQYLLSRSALDNLCNGWMGTYALCQKNGMVLTETALDVALFPEPGRINEEKPAYGNGLSPTERHLIDSFRELAPSDRDRVAAIAELFTGFNP